MIYRMRSGAMAYEQRQNKLSSCSNASHNLYRVGITATIEVGYTLYHVSVTCAMTREWKLIKRRYSDFHTLHQKLKSISFQGLSPLLRVPFPRKRFTRDTRKIIIERMRLLKRFTCQLLDFRQHCLHVTMYLRDLIDNFLELRLYRSELLTVLEPSQCDLCSICFERTRVNTTIQILPCRHEYHLNCISQWLILKADCPLCRNPFSSGYLL
ncbi:hypothetical protein THRCLA_02634 [Thraustotheca clavata]|uniref:RING-type E3 ubiquitin transferase n=1 Tax=Thraustotheca clavata TaxID=74557 RepID=A0A1W0A4H5_9STRA|nr:hypothetical protein THRCLA_02634 [Thraustotheca clavata]